MTVGTSIFIEQMSNPISITRDSAWPGISAARGTAFSDGCSLRGSLLAPRNYHFSLFLELRMMLNPCSEVSAATDQTSFESVSIFRLLWRIIRIASDSFVVPNEYMHLLFGCGGAGCV